MKPDKTKYYSLMCCNLDSSIEFNYMILLETSEEHLNQPCYSLVDVTT